VDGEVLFTWPFFHSAVMMDVLVDVMTVPPEILLRRFRGGLRWARIRATRGKNLEEGSVGLDIRAELMLSAASLLQVQDPPSTLEVLIMVLHDGEEVFLMGSPERAKKLADEILAELGLKADDLRRVTNIVMCTNTHDWEDDWP
jgi:hypothetical protein